MIKLPLWIKEYKFPITVIILLLIFFLIKDYFPTRHIDRTEFWPNGVISHKIKQKSDGSIIETFWYDTGIKHIQKVTSPDRKHVWMSQWYRSDQIESVVEFKDNKKHGTWMLWNKSGVLESKDEFFEGKLHGLSVSYHDIGTKLSEINYKNGKKHGVFRLYDYQGNLLKEELYDNGNVIKY